MKVVKLIALAAALLLTLGLFPCACTGAVALHGWRSNAQKVPNGAMVNAAVLETSAKIVYLEPTTEKVAEGVWCIGGHSIGNTTVIEADDGLIVYDTGDNKEEGEHLRKAIAEISDKPIKAIIYSHSHYAFGAWRVFLTKPGGPETPGLSNDFDSSLPASSKDRANFPSRENCNGRKHKTQSNRDQMKVALDRNGCRGSTPNFLNNRNKQR